MPEYSFIALGFSDLVVTGPDPFDSNSRPESDAYFQTTLRIAPGAGWKTLTMTDNDAFLEDGDSRQELTEPLTINGRTYDVEQSVEIEYSYLIRPVGSTDPADYITIYVLEFGTRVQGIATNQQLARDVVYQIIDGTNDPVVPYSELVICFTPGAAITTPRGPVAVERLRAGDLVCTVDNGEQPLAWVGRQRAVGVGPGLPVRVAPGALGNARELILSQQHRVTAPPSLGLGRDLIVPVKALVGQPGISCAPRLQVDYIHLLFEAHEMILAEGAAMESFLPGPQALKSLPRRDRADVLSLFPDLRRRVWDGARPILRVGQVRRALARSAVRPGVWA